MRGDSTKDVKARWLNGAGQYLQSTLEELTAEAPVWVLSMIGVTPDRALVKQADLRAWEAVTIRSAQRLLAAGNATEGLKRFRERDERSPGSPLLRLEFDALRLLGRTREAREVAQRGIQRSARTGAPTVHRELNLQLALLDEASNDVSSALTHILQALNVPGDTPEAIDQLRLLITEIRLLRKLGDTYNDKRRAAIDAAKKLLTGETYEALARRPAVLREIVAELGVIDADILKQGLETLGLRVRTATQAEILADSLSNWGEVISQKTSGSETNFPWKKEVSSLRQGDLEGTASLARNIVRLRAEFGPDREVDKAVVRVFRDNVEEALQVASAVVS